MPHLAFHICGDDFGVPVADTIDAAHGMILSNQLISKRDLERSKWIQGGTEHSDTIQSEHIFENSYNILKR